MPARSRSDARSTGYFGKPGSFSHEVAQRRFPGSPLLPFEQMSGAFAALRDGRCERAVVPFENSIGGAVPDTLDQLVLMRDWEKQFAILEQLVFPVRLCLMRLPVAGRLERVYSHFVPLQVVRPWLARHHPGAETVEAASTSSAALAASRDPGGAAVGNEAAAGVYGLRVSERDLAPSSLNVTRFLVVGPRTGPDAAPDPRRPARAMVHLQLKHQPGALADVLLLLKKRRVNLTQLLSRPVQGRLGQHRFLIEMDLPRDPKVTARLWPALERLTTAMHLLGEYPVAKVR